jgi:hypothetical protein
MALTQQAYQNAMRKTISEADNKLRAFVLTLSNSVIKATPVDTGRASGNWFPDVNSTNITQKETGNASDSQVRVSVTASQVKIGDTYTLTNNLPYINKLEYGSSKQAPQGMVRVNIQRVSEAFRRKWGMGR